uniref:Extracellular serine-rich protein n=1 Tax=Colletotrichum fructicola (strain Nara gc5) TaxID=1213859 RepID=L2FX86_COLFN
MFSIKTLTTILLASAAAVSAAPTTTTGSTKATRTTHLTGVTHSVVAGLGGLRFDPDNVVAEIGDVPLADGSGFFPGFEFFTPEGQAPDVFQIVVEDKKPIWYYCAQPAMTHCNAGMVGVVNQNFDNQDFSLAKHKELAAKATLVIPPVKHVGKVIPNPNPLGGF